MGHYVSLINGMSNAQADDFMSFATDLLDGNSGIVASGDYAVAQSSPVAMSVTVATGKAYIYISSLLSYYRTILDAAATLSIASNSSGSTRIDLICIKIDTGATPDANASNVASVVVVQGTPGGGAPATPANHYKLAEVTVASGAASIANANIADSRVQISLRLGIKSNADTIATLAATQTLTNKTLTSPVVITSVDNVITTTGSANTYLAAPTTALGAYAAGLRLRIKINATNTNASTINVSSLGAKNILKSDGSALIGNELLTNGIYDLVYDGTSFIAINIPHYQPKCSITKTGSQSISNATFITLSFDTELFDTGAMHDNSSNNSRITIPTGYNGTYIVNASIAWAAAFGVGSPYAPVRVIVILYKNGVSLRELYDSDYGSVSSTDPTMAPMTAIVPAVGGDYFELQVYQNSGVSKSISSSTIFECSKLL